MAMTGLQIFKLLPKTNCGECGVPTCMAFAMKLAAKNAELAACPYASEEAIKTVGAASKPPIRLVKIGPPEREVLIGNETVMFRHDKTFVHPTAIAMAFSDSEPLTEASHLHRGGSGVLPGAGGRAAAGQPGAGGQLQRRSEALRRSGEDRCRFARAWASSCAARTWKPWKPR